MAWNQFQNYNFPQGNGQMPMQAQPVMQNTFMPIVVRDKSEAESYPMAANTTISMRDESFTHMWIKSTNASGTVVAFRTFNVSEVVEEKPQYITMADFEAFKKELFDSLGGNVQNMMSQFQRFQQQIQQQGINPQQQVMQLLQSGKMSQQQFEQLKSMASMMSGMFGNRPF